MDDTTQRTPIGLRILEKNELGAIVWDSTERLLSEALSSFFKCLSTLKFRFQSRLESVELPNLKF